ncbi:MAG: hypothetical protein JWM11_3564 [Planctomycetaceae bacterium]|nr:hypothetical protein [Planctomycetaceae bacterium]
MCDRWRQVAGQRKIDLAPARLVGVSRSDFHGQYAASLSEPTFRKLSNCLVPVKNVATALGLWVSLKSRPVALRLNSVRVPIFARDSQPNPGFEPRQDAYDFSHWLAMAQTLERRTPRSNVSRRVPVSQTQKYSESSNFRPTSMVTGGQRCERVPSTSFPVLRTGRNCMATGLISSDKRLPKTMTLAHAPDWVWEDLPFSERHLRSLSVLSPPAGTTPMPAKGSILHEKRDAHQCPPTGGEPDRHC